MRGQGRVRVSVLGCVLVAVSLLATAVVALLVVASVPDRLGLLLSIVAASIPALVYAAIVLRLDRYEIEPTPRRAGLLRLGRGRRRSCSA